MSLFPDPHAPGQPPHAHLPLLRLTQNDAVRPSPRPANDPAPGVPLRPYAARPANLLDGLRCVPLGSFAWGGHGTLRRPRARADSVLITVREGCVQLGLARGTQAHGAGTVIFVPTGSAFSAHCGADAAGRVLLIPRGLTGNLAQALPQEIVAGCPSDEIRDDLDAQITALAREAARVARTGRLAVELRLSLVAIALQHDDAFRGPTTAAGVRPDRTQHQVVDEFLALASRELGRGRTVSDLAQSLGLTTATLDAACRGQRGRSALELIHDLRLQRALPLLRGSNRSLKAIAAQLGYTGAGHLTRAFMAATGRTPDSFRTEGEA